MRRRSQAGSAVDLHTPDPNMVLWHNLYETGPGAVEVLAEESSAVSQATEAFR